MAPDSARNLAELHQQTKGTVRRLGCPNDLDHLVMNVVADLVETGHYHDNDADDTRLLQDCRRSLMILGPTLTAAEVDRAISRWQRLNEVLACTKA